MCLAYLLDGILRGAGAQQSHNERQSLGMVGVNSGNGFVRTNLLEAGRALVS
jgi:hypothetical protein